MEASFQGGCNSRKRGHTLHSMIVTWLTKPKLHRKLLTRELGCEALAHPPQALAKLDKKVSSAAAGEEVINESQVRVQVREVQDVLEVVWMASKVVRGLTQIGFASEN